MACSFESRENGSHAENIKNLNKVLASVVIPPDGVSPVAMQAKEGATPASAQTGSQPAHTPPKPPAAQQQHK